MVTNEELRKTIIDMVTESWRLSRTLNKVLQKLDVNEKEKYSSQFMWYFRKVEDALAISGLREISLEGQLYDPGMAVTPMNIDDFEADEQLYVVQMLEPIIMDTETAAVLKTGTVMLGRK